MISDRENLLRAIEFRHPEWIPIDFDLMASIRFRHGKKLAEMMSRHPMLFSATQVAGVAATVPPPEGQHERRFTDDWDCEWLEVEAGILGQVVGHPLSEWGKLADLKVPDPRRQWNWDSVRAECARQRERGELVNGYMDIVKGSFFDRLQFLRGLDNLLVDLMERPPELDRFIALVLDYNLRLIRLWLDAGAELIHFHGDIGMQNSLMISPATFREVLKPAYREMFQMCRRGGAHVKYSSDGCLLEIVDDLVECGASFHDPQVRACGIDGIARTYGGKLCAMVDIDEQMLPFASPPDIDAQIREIVEKVGRPEGGLMLYACPSADVPLENIEAICTAWEQYCAPGNWRSPAVGSLQIPGVSNGLAPDRRVAAPQAARPRFVLEGHEDEIYHELRVGARATEPDYCAFLDQSWTFNRAMRWLTGPADTLLCYEAGGNLALTGEQRVADWFSDPANRLTHNGAALRFEKAAARQRDAVVLPGFQTNLDQHPTLRVTVSEANAAWQVCVLVKGRSGPPLLASDWQVGPGSVTLDLAAAWAAKGYAIRFAELHFALGVWTEQPESPATLTFTAELPGQAALVPCLPVIRKVGKPVPVAALLVAVDGNLPGAGQIQVAASVAGRTVPLRRDGAVWRGEVGGLPVGEYTVALHATGAVAATASLALHITDGQFLGYDAGHKTLTRAGKAVGPVSGSYQGMVFARDPGTLREVLVQGQAAWEAWHQAEPEAEHWHYWEALTEAELEERFAYLERCGWNILHICQGWGVWEKLDAGGHLAPHGAEQLALLLRVAGRHGLALLQALSHYPYGSKFTPVLRQYLEAGYQDSDWTHPETPFTVLFHQYLREYTALFRDEPALFAMSTSGEGDIAAGPARVNDTYRFMREHMPNHVFLAEPIHRLHRLPEEHRAQWAVHGWSESFAAGCRKDVAWAPQLAGSRMYWIGEALHPEIDLGVEFKFLQLADTFMGEGSWPCPHRYARFMGHQDTWAGTERYRRRVRDSLYLGLVHRNPILLTWDEQYTEDERIVLRQVRELIDWSQPFQQAPVGIRVGSPNVGGGPWGAEGRAVLGRYEEFFSALPLMTRYLTPEETAPDGLPVLDARQPYTEPLLPSELLASGPLQVSPGYRASYLWSADRCTLLAYICNSTHHECLEGRPDLSGNWHRLPQPAPCNVTLRNLPSEKLTCRVYSLDAKRCVRELALSGGASVELGRSTDDYCALVYQE